MKEAYPISMPCRLEGFPARIRTVCGERFSLLDNCSYSYGSVVVCSQTPQSGVADGAYVQGEALPDHAVIYSDSGEDDAFGLKLSFYGHGTFYLPDAEARCCALEVRKGIRIRAAGLDKRFETVDTWETRIPADQDLTQEEVWSTYVGTDADAADGRFSATWLLSGAQDGVADISGVLQLGGETGVRLVGDET